MRSHFSLTESGVWILILIASLVALTGLAYLTIDVDFPFRIATSSRALYVDEGFYSDAAQNFVNFGTFELPHDTKHWPGAPLLTIFQAPVFSLFGPTITVVRMLSVIVSAIGCLAFYLVIRDRFQPAMAAILTLAAITSIGFIGHARSAIPDPIALSMAMLAMLVFVKMKNRQFAIVLSLGLAYMSFLAKMYFFFTLTTLGTVWAGEILLLPLLAGRRINWRLLLTLVATTVTIIGSYAWFRVAFGESMNDFLIVNSKKRLLTGVEWQVRAFFYSLGNLPFFTRITVAYYALWAAVAVILLMTVVKVRSVGPLITGLRSVKRSEWVMTIFVLSGLVVVGSLQEHKWHYYYFAIFPLLFLTAAAIDRIGMPRRWRNIAIAALILGHVLEQGSLNMSWFERGNSTTIADASIAIARTIEAEASYDKVPVIGDFSQILALYSPSILGIDTMAPNPELLCERIDFWKPVFHVQVVWKGSDTQEIPGRMAACPGVSSLEEVSRHRTMPAKGRDEIVLSRIIYGSSKNCGPAKTCIPGLLLLL